MTKLDDIINAIYINGQNENTVTFAKQQIKTLFFGLIGEDMKAKFPDDEGGKKFASGYSFAKSELRKKVNEL